MKKLIALLVLALCAFGCSSETMTSEDAAASEQWQPLISPCAIGGAAGIADATYITRVKIDDLCCGTRLAIDFLDPVAHVRDTANITFRDVHWSPFHTVNGDQWHAWSDASPLRRLEFKGPGCASSSPSSYCMYMMGDVIYSDHVNELQNVEVFLSDRPVSPTFNPANGSGSPGQITAPLGYGITRIEGMSVNPTNTLRVSAVNAAHTGIQVKDFKFTTPGCP